MKDSPQDYDGKLAIDNADIARVFERIAELLEFKDENPFKTRSYRLASETISEMSESLTEIAARGGAAELQRIPGIGKSISNQIVEITKTGTSGYFEELKEEVPETVLELRRVSGVGLKTSQLLYREFGIKSLEELKAFAEGGGLESVPGLGEKTAERIRKSLARIESERGMMRLNDAIDLARTIIDRLMGKKNGGPADGIRVECVGQIRRGREMVDSIELLATGDRRTLLSEFAALPQIAEVRSVREDRIEAETKKGVLVALHLAPGADFAAATVRTTGSIEHVRDLESEAESRGLAFIGFKLASAESKRQRMAHDALSRGAAKGKKQKATGDEDSIKIESEEDFYNTLGLSFIPPEVREGIGEVEAAREDRLPQLIELDDIRGDFHMHTVWSDGRNTVREMVEAARQKGFHYIAITDHTESSSIANGNTPEQLLEEIEEIESVAAEFDDIKVLKGAEVDILSDGSLDMPFEVLDRLDWIVCSIHSGFNQPGQQITDRVVTAFKTGYPNVFAHPTGRILGERAPYEIDLEQVIAAAQRYDVRLELNASPYRLDLDSYWLRAARDAGVGIVISTDSHQTSGFASMYYGVVTARRAWLTANDVLNTLPLDQLLSELNRKKSLRSSKS
ncbi:MAG TPA: DNA polymerase/3'-5' exonuclease PolX [Blastocatellia bacterium]|nr:DNA polymerase/3'-5' exonuclease PolX [Blastocatellia bacterium]